MHVLPGIAVSVNVTWAVVTKLTKGVKVRATGVSTRDLNSVPA